MNTIQEMCRHYSEAENYTIGDKNYPNLFMTGLYGSQNYGLDTEYSDVDTLSIILPSFSTLVYPQSHCTYLDEDNHILVHCVKDFGKMLINESNQALELLYTDYKIVNPKYKNFWEQLIDMREEIVRVDRKHYVMSTLSCAKNHFNAAAKGSDNTPKRYARGKYFTRMVEKYLDNQNFGNVLKATVEETLEYFFYREQKPECLADLAVNACEEIDKRMNEFAKYNFGVKDYDMFEKVHEWVVNISKGGVM